MLRRLIVLVAFAACLASSGAARAEANVVRVAKQFGVGYMQYMVMQELKLVEKHAKAAGLDVTSEWATFRSSDVMNDALISGSVDFVSLGVPGIITINSKTKGTANEVKGVLGLNISPLMLVVRDPAIKSLKDFKDNHRIALPAVKVSNQAIILQMAAAKEFGEAKYAELDKLTVSMSHPDATAAMLGGAARDHGELLLGAVPVPAAEEPEQQAVAELGRPVPRRSDVVQRRGVQHQVPHRESEAVRGFRRGDEGGDLHHQRRQAQGRGDLSQGIGREDERATTSWKCWPTRRSIYNNQRRRHQAFVDFMAKTGSLKNPPKDWKDMFFPEAFGSGT